MAIRALMDFRYLAQSQVISDATCSSIEYSLQEFHSNKQAILDAGARRGKKSAILNWYIPKLEFLQSVVSNIRANGVAIQWSADATEHAHIMTIKDPARSGNNQNYESQICRYLDRLDKLRQFDLATAIREANIDFQGSGAEECGSEAGEQSDLDDGNFLLVTSTSSLLTYIDPVSSLSGASRQIFDFFGHASVLKRSLQNHQDIPFPLRTHACTNNVAFHLSRDPSFKRLLVDDVARMYGITDLRPALSDYLQRIENHNEGSRMDVRGRRVAHENCDLPFSHLEVWKRMHLQSKAYYHPHALLPSQTINALPLSSSSSFGQFDNVIINIDSTKEWPVSGLSGMSVRCIVLYPHR